MGQQNIDPVILFLRYNLTPLDVVMDVGANRGQIAKEINLIGAKGFSFEPNPPNASIIRSMELANITVIEAAVSDVSGTMPLYVITQEGRDPTGLASSLRRLSGVTDEMVTPIPVPVVTLDEFCASNSIIPTVIKIDVEGVEDKVIRGAANIIAEHKPKIIFELWGSLWNSYLETINDLLHSYYIIRASNGKSAFSEYANGCPASEIDNIICLPKQR